MEAPPDARRSRYGGALADSPLDPRTWTRRTRRVAAFVLAALAAFALLSVLMPVDAPMRPLPEPSVVLLDRDGTPFARRGGYKEAPVDVGELPAHVVDAVLAVEDQRFRVHPGLDPVGIARAAVRNAEAGEIEQGGSTITQQLAKTTWLSSDRTLARKVVEAVGALWLELRLDKDEILSRYLGSIYFGDGVHGLPAASRHYFDKTPADLSLAEAAMLAGMIKAPSALAPTHDLEAARARARTVMDLMEGAGMITAGQRAAAGDASVRPGRPDLPVGGYFADWVSAQAKASVEPAFGMQAVRTTLDGRLQGHAEDVVRWALDHRGRRKGATQAAVVAMTAQGEVLALVGGRDYADSQFDRATQARRQPGSVFKLFVYLAALRDGMRPDDTVLDAPLDAGRDWRPGNYDDRYAGELSLREAFARSSNVAAVRLAEDVGPRAVVRAARDLGIESELSADPTIALGTSEVGLMELTAAFAALAAGHAPVRPTGIPRAGGDGAPGRDELPEEDRGHLLDLLWTAVDSGTGRAARLWTTPVFGKTGTTQDHRDAWFIGMAQDVVVGVWVGNDDNAPMDGVTGGGLPAEIWRDVAREAVRLRGQGAVGHAGDAPDAGVGTTKARGKAKGQAKRGGKGKGKGRGRRGG